MKFEIHHFILENCHGFWNTTETRNFKTFKKWHCLTSTANKQQTKIAKRLASMRKKRNQASNKKRNQNVNQNNKYPSWQWPTTMATDDDIIQQWQSMAINNQQSTKSRTTNSDNHPTMLKNATEHYGDDQHNWTQQQQDKINDCPSM